jgi:hypothetical protein
MNLVVFDGQLLFEDSGCELSSEACKLLGTPGFMKAVILVCSSPVAYKRMKAIIEIKEFCYNVTVDSYSRKDFFLMNILRSVGPEKAKNVFVAAHVSSPDIYLGNKLGFNTIGILADNPEVIDPGFPDSPPVYTRYRIGDVTDILQPKKQNTLVV